MKLKLLPICCRSNAKGRCKACSCKKRELKCFNCLPSKNFRCENLLSPGEDGPSATVLTATVAIIEDEHCHAGGHIPPPSSTAESAQVVLPLPVVNVIDSNHLTTRLDDSFEHFLIMLDGIDSDTETNESYSEERPISSFKEVRSSVI